MENENNIGIMVSPPKITIEGQTFTNAPRYFNKGDRVRVEKLPNSPIMLVTDIVFEKDDQGKVMVNDYGNRILKGIECTWFGLDSECRKELWNSKDLILECPAEKKKSI